MNAGDLKKHLPRTRSSRLWAAGWVAAAAFGLALLLAPLENEHGRGTATPTVLTPPVVKDPAWGKLSAIEQRTLEPLKTAWSTLTAEQQEKWRLVADRFQAKPWHVQRRLTARIAEWALLTPQQRANARLNFLELAKHYDPRQRKEQWRAYHNAEPIQRHSVIGSARQGIVPPVFVQVSPGATTVLLSQLFDLPSQGDAAERDEAALDPPPIDEQNPQRMGAASASAGIAADLERAEPLRPDAFAER